jgi:two-component system nitrogen regulation response regulator GlnG/two-component system response regulator HydG
MPPPLALTLVVAWSSDEPRRLGEVCLLPLGEPGPWRVFGRGEPQASDPHARLEFMRLRPGGSSTTGFSENVRISRVQMLLRASGGQSIEVTNVGQTELWVNGRPMQSGHIEPGDLVQLGKQLLFLCCKRPAWEEALPEYPEFGFGEADLGGFIGESAAAWAARRQTAAAARDFGHVLITGASGTGKELVARSIHELSDRAARPLVSRNAATFPEGLVDAELFGNAKNYPNGGMADRPGLIGEAHQSSLFLDEIGELPASMQSHLLRVLDSGEYQRLGDSGARRADIRVIAATNRDFSHLKQDFLARFRIRLHLTDLNARREDIPLIARALWSESRRNLNEALAERDAANGKEHVPLDLMSQLIKYRYTVNVRELDRLLRDAILGVNSADMDSQPASSAFAPVQSLPVVRVDPTSITAEQIREALALHQGRQERVWRALGLSSRYALWRLMKKHNIDSWPK